MKFLTGHAIPAFLLSRALVLFIMTIAVSLEFRGVPGWEGTIWHGTAEIHATQLKPALAKRFLGGDASWYVWIAKYGYSPAPPDIKEPQNWVFFPLIPLLLRGGHALTGSYFYSGILISNLAFLATLLLLERHAPRFGFSPQATRAAIWLWAFWPVSYFCSAPLTESVYALLLLSAFIALQQQQLLRTGILFALTTAARPTGMLMLPGYAIGIFRSSASIMKRLAALALMPLGLLAYMGFLYALNGDPLVFVKNQMHWGRGSSFLQLVQDLVSQPNLWMKPWNFDLLNFSAALICLWSCWKLIQRRRVDLALCVFIPLAAAFATGTMQSTARFCLVFFPVFLCLGEKFQEDSRLLPAVAVSSALLAGMTILYAFTVTAGMA